MVFDALAKDFTAWLSADGRNFLFAGGVLPCEVVKPELLMAPNTGSTLCMVRWEFGADADRWTFIPVGTDRTPSSFPISPIRFFASNPHLPAQSGEWTSTWQKLRRPFQRVQGGHRPWLIRAPL
jgi:hypothetical protein